MGATTVSVVQATVPAGVGCGMCLGLHCRACCPPMQHLCWPHHKQLLLDIRACLCSNDELKSTCYTKPWCMCSFVLPQLH